MAYSVRKCNAHLATHLYFFFVLRSQILRRLYAIDEINVWDVRGIEVLCYCCCGGWPFLYAYIQTITFIRHNVSVRPYLAYFNSYLLVSYWMVYVVPTYLFCFGKSSYRKNVINKMWGAVLCCMLVSIAAVHVCSDFYRLYDWVMTLFSCFYMTGFGTDLIKRLANINSIDSTENRAMTVQCI